MQTVVGVIRGGGGKRHEASLADGAAILNALPEDAFSPRDFYIDADGTWFERGKVVAPERALRQIDTAFVCTPEKREVLDLVERFGIPHTGTKAFPLRLGTHSLVAKVRAQEEGLQTPRFKHVEAGADAESFVRDVIRSFAQPVVVKPVGGAGRTVVTGGYAPVLEAVRAAFRDGATSVLAEEYVRGTHAFVGIVEALRGDDFYALPIAEVSDEGVRCPASFSEEECEALRRAARVMHRALSLRHYSQSSFILSPRGVFYVGTRAYPRLVTDAVLPASLQAVGISPSAFAAHLVNRSLLR